MQDATGIEADHTHFYPGATARVLPGAAPRDGALVVHFADGSTASGTLAAETLTVAPYRTRAGPRSRPGAGESRGAQTGCASPRVCLPDARRLNPVAGGRYDRKMTSL